MPHDHPHNHAHHSHHGHSHGSTNRHVLRVSLAVIGGFMLVEAAAGWLSSSLALLSDAGHMFSDAAALALALAAFKWADKAADPRKSYGYRRVEILAAALNGLTLVVMAVWIAAEAVVRLFRPVEVAGGAMLGVAVLGLFANLFVAWYMLRGERGNLNMRGAFLHVLGDLLGSVAAVAAGLLIWLYGWTWADLAASVLVAALIGKSGWGVLSASLHILMEGTPENTDLAEIAAEIQSIDGVLGLHDLHAWTITSSSHALSCHIAVADGWTVAQAAELAARIEHAVQAHGIGHVTVQAEPAGRPHRPTGGHADCNNGLAG